MVNCPDCCLLCLTAPLPSYRAPEQWQAGKLTNRVDIWAWGCLMIQLLTGQPPWIGLNMYQVCEAELRSCACGTSGFMLSSGDSHCDTLFC